MLVRLLWSKYIALTLRRRRQLTWRACTMQATGSTGAATPRFATLRVGMRYVGVDGTERDAAAPSIAGSPPYLVLPSARRSLLAEPSKTDYTRRVAKSRRLAKSQRPAVAGCGSASKLSRKLLQSVTTSSDLLWLDIQGDGAVTSSDSDTFFCVQSAFPPAPSADDFDVCALLDALYNPSTAAATSLIDETLDDSSFVSTSSETWQAVDPRLLYLRGDEPFAFADGAACPALLASQSVPQLSRFDGTRPPTRAEYEYLVTNTDEQYDELMQPSNPDFLVYQVRSCPSCLGSSTYPLLRQVRVSFQ